MPADIYGNFQETWRFVNENLTVQTVTSQEN